MIFSPHLDEILKGKKTFFGNVVKQTPRWYKAGDQWWLRPDVDPDDDTVLPGQPVYSDDQTKQRVVGFHPKYLGEFLYHFCDRCYFLQMYGGCMTYQALR